MAYLLSGDVATFSADRGQVFYFSPSISGDPRIALKNSNTDFGAKYGIAISNDRLKIYLASSGSPYIRILNVSTGVLDSNPASVPAAFATSCFLNSDGSELCVTNFGSSGTGTIVRYDTSNMSKLTDPSTWPTGLPRKGDYSSDDVWLAIPHETTPYITIYERGTMTKISNPATLPANTGLSAKFSPDNAFLAVGGVGNPSLRIYDTSNWSSVSLTTNITIQISQLAWSPDGSKLAVGSENSPYIAVYNTSNWTQITLPSFSAYQMQRICGLHWLNNDVLLGGIDFVSVRQSAFITIDITNTSVLNYQTNGLQGIGLYGLAFTNGMAYRTLSGTVVDTSSPPDGLERTVRAYDRQNGSILAETVSASDGTFELVVYTSSPCYVVALGADGSPNEISKIVDRVGPIST